MTARPVLGWHPMHTTNAVGEAVIGCGYGWSNQPQFQFPEHPAHRLIEKEGTSLMNRRSLLRASALGLPAAVLLAACGSTAPTVSSVETYAQNVLNGLSAVLALPTIQKDLGANLAKAQAALDDASGLCRADGRRGQPHQHGLADDRPADQQRRHDHPRPRPDGSGHPLGRRNHPDRHPSGSAGHARERRRHQHESRAVVHVAA